MVQLVRMHWNQIIVELRELAEIWEVLIERTKDYVSETKEKALAEASALS